MRKYILFPAMLFMAVLPFVSCELETSDNGDLDGMWFLTQVDTIATSGVRDMSDERIYWSFQHNLMKVDDKTGTNSSILLRFDRADGNMTLSDPYIDDRGSGDVKLEDVDALRPFGINDIPETFKMAHLSGRHMTIESPVLRLWFRKL